MRRRMGEGFRGQVILGWPSNRSDIDRLNEGLEPQQHFRPSVEHMLSTCDNGSCQRGIWIGPAQKQLVGNPLMRVRKLCIFCAAEVKHVLNLIPEQVELNPAIHNARPRTT